MWYLILVIFLPAALSIDKNNCSVTDTLLCRSSYYDVCYTDADSKSTCYCDNTNTYIALTDSLLEPCKQKGVIGGVFSSLFGQVSTTLILVICGFVCSIISLIMQFCLFRKQISTESALAFNKVKRVLKRKPNRSVF